MNSPRMLDTRQLKHIVELDRYRNFRRAAETLCISQPALTKSIQQLEATLGIVLFDRESGDIAPTPSCRVILEHARRVLLEMDELHQRLDSLNDSCGGELKIGSGPIMAEHVLPEPLRQLLSERPDLRVQIVVDDWVDLVRLLRHGDLHAFVIDIARLRDEPDLEVVSLGRIENILVCRAGHPLAAAGEVSARDFRQFPLALPSITNHLSNWLKENAPNDMSSQSYHAAAHRVQCQSLPLLRSLVHHTNCITGGPPSLFANEIAAGSLVELHLDHCDALYSEPCISYLKARTLPPAARRFIELMGNPAPSMKRTPSGKVNQRMPRAAQVPRVAAELNS